MQVELAEDDFLYQNQQKALSQLQNFSKQQEQKQLSKLDDVSCWSETQNSFYYNHLNQSQQIESQPNLFFKMKENYNVFAKVKDEEKQVNQLLPNQIGLESRKNSHKKEHLLEQSKQNISKRVSNLKSNSINQHYGSKCSIIDNNQNFRRECSPSLQKVESKLLKQNCRILLQNNTFKTGVNDLGFMLKIKMRISYFLRSFTFVGRNKSITSKIKRYINDKSCYFDDFNQMNTCETKVMLFRVIINLIRSLNIKVIDGQSNIGLSLSFFFILFNSFFLFLLSLYIVFQAHAKTINQIFFFTSIIWVIESFVKINCTLFINHHIITERYQIITHYLKNKLIFDFIPLAIISCSDNKITQSLAFIKIINIISELNSFQTYLVIIIRRYYIVSLISLIFKIFIFGHIISCMWYLVAIIEIYILQTNSWIEEGLDIYNDWWLIYFQSLYWALTLMTTGSNIATTTLQTVFTCSTMIFTTIAFAYLLNVVGFILETIDSQNEQKRSDINILNEYMRKKNISKCLQQKINLNLEYYYNRNIYQIHQDSQQILDKIPSDLKSALNKEFNEKIIYKIPVLRDYFSKKTVDKLCYIAKEEYYLPNQVICDDQALETSLICIVSGSGLNYFRNFIFYIKHFLQYQLLVQVTNIKSNIIQGNQNQQTFSQVEQGGTCCEVDFFTCVNQKNIIRSAEYTQILRITSSDFANIVKEHKKDFEIYCQIRDKILLYEQYSYINVKCLICDQYSHQIIECPLVNYQKNIYSLKIGFTQSKQQVRQKSERKITQKKKFNIISQNDIQYCLFLERTEIEDYLIQVLAKYVNQNFKETSSSSEEEGTQISLKKNDQSCLFCIIEEEENDLSNQKTRKSMSHINGQGSYIFDKNKKERCSIVQNIDEMQLADSIEFTQLNSDKNIQNREKVKQIQHIMKIKSDLSQEDVKSEQLVKNSETDKQTFTRNSKKFCSNQFSYLNSFQDESHSKNQKTLNRQITAQSNLKSSLIYKLQQATYSKMQSERDQSYLWNFDKLQDYNFYFRNGNSGIRIQKFLRFQTKMLKKTKKINNKQD